MSEMTTAWQSGHFTEVEIVQAYESTHLAFRQALRAEDLPMPSVTPPEVHDEIYFEVVMGVDEHYESIQWIAKEYGLPYATAYRYVKEKSGAALLRVRSRANIPDLLAQGYSQAEVAELLGVSQATVSNHNPNRRTKERGKSLTDAEWKQVQVELQRLSVSEVARLYRVSRAQIYARLKKC